MQEAVLHGWALQPHQVPTVIQSVVVVEGPRVRGSVTLSPQLEEAGQAGKGT